MKPTLPDENPIVYFFFGHVGRRRIHIDVGKTENGLVSPMASLKHDVTKDHRARKAVGQLILALSLETIQVPQAEGLNILAGEMIFSTLFASCIGQRRQEKHRL